MFGAPGAIIRAARSPLRGRRRRLRRSAPPAAACRTDYLIPGRSHI